MNDIYPGIAFGDTGGKLTFMSSLPNPSGRGRIQISDDAAKSIVSDLKAMKETTTKAFTAEPGGTWSFESKCGYGQILDVTDYDYNGVKRYEVNSWGPNVDSGYTKNYYFDLNAAKRGRRDEIIRLYGEQKKKK